MTLSCAILGRACASASAITGEFHGLGVRRALEMAPQQVEQHRRDPHQQGAAQSPREPAFHHCQMREAVDQRQRYDGAAQQNSTMVAAEMHKLARQYGFGFVLPQYTQEHIGEHQAMPADHVGAAEPALGRGQQINFLERHAGFKGQLENAGSQVPGRKLVAAELLQSSPDPRPVARGQHKQSPNRRGPARLD